MIVVTGGAALVRSTPSKSAAENRFHRLARQIAVLAVSLTLAACAIKPADPAPAPQTETLPDLMHKAETAMASGDKAKGREYYQAASKIDPTSKAPWVKLAENYFEEGDYGNAVLAAQEVLHRDGTDNVGAGILAVSGLRISTSALTVLRQQNNITAGTRGEAETLTRSLRELLGENVLVPRPEPAPQRPRPRPSAAAAAQAASTPSTASAKAPVAAPATAAKSGGNPFDKLK
jgi:Tfp pilus assembly protein PilF